MNKSLAVSCLLAISTLAIKQNKGAFSLGNDSTTAIFRKLELAQKNMTLA